MMPDGSAIIAMPKISRRYAGHQPFLAGEVARATKRLFVGNDADVRVDLCVQVVGYEPVADAHLQMRADRPSREDRRVLWLDRPYLDGRVLRLEDFADPA